MAVDDILNDRIRAALAAQGDLSERRMMGGTCFMVGDHMLGGAHRDADGGRTFMFRVGKENMAQALTRPAAREVRFGARKLGGFVHVDATQCSDEALGDWLAICLDFISGLPPKTPKGGAKR